MATISTFFHALAVRRGRLAAMAGLMLAAAAHGAPSVYPTGVTRYDPHKAWNGYVVFSGADRKTRLIDMNGNEVRRWDYPGFPAVLLDPARAGGARGRVLVQLAGAEKPHPLASPGNGLGNQAIGELDWDGEVVWRWGDSAPDGAARQHHDLRRLPNGNTLVLVNKPHPVAGFDVPEVIDDAVYEITPDGEIAWSWLASEHLEEFGFTAEQLALVRATKNPDYLHINNLSVLGPNRWFDAGDARFHPDNLMIDARNANFIAIIAKASGKVVWHLGPGLPPIDPKAGQHVPRPVDQFVGQHDAHLIPAGLPGAGNLLVFDNQGAAGYPPAQLQVTSGSRVLEIDPVSQQIVWQYSAERSQLPGWAFFSSFISSARRLPNGNTLIDEGMTGRFFQVTTQGEIVWEYVSPYFGKAPHGDASSNWVYRATPVPYDWVPEGTARSEQAVIPTLPGQVPAQRTAAR
jgi:hypothetical protein